MKQYSVVLLVEDATRSVVQNHIVMANNENEALGKVIRDTSREFQNWAVTRHLTIEVPKILDYEVEVEPEMIESD